MPLNAYKADRDGNGNVITSTYATKAHASTATTYGASSASNYGHAKASTTTPKVAGTAAVGSETSSFARGDHVHPAQTSVSGNAGTATKLATARTFSLTGDVTGSASFDGSANASIAVTVKDDSHNHILGNIDNLPEELDSRSYLTEKYSVSAGDGNVHYYKLFTITPTSTGYGDVHYIFEVTARANRFTKIYVFASTANEEKYFSTTYLTYEGPLGTEVKAYRFKDTTNKTERLEIWGKISSWDTWRIVPKTYQPNTYINNLEWNGEEGSAFPTNATTNVGVTARNWLGNAATATSATKATQDGSGNVITSTYATKTELSNKANSSHSHSASDITSGTLNAARIPNISIDKLVAGTTNTTIPSSLLPSYVDDVLEYTAKSSFPSTGETGKIYVDKTTNLTYRWSGSAYVEISPSLALGTTSSTAYRGDYGNAAYTHAVTNKGIAKSSGLYKITTNSEGHVTAATAVTKADITALGIPGTAISVKLNGTTTTSANFYAPLSAGTSGYVLKSNGSGAPTWLNPSSLSVGSATKATQDGNGNVISSTYLPLAGGKLTGPVISQGNTV